MSESWGAVVAAVAAGVFGIAGTFAGIFVGRRQTTDAAAVEHRQWLRGQRQEAYVAFLAAWDNLVRAMSAYARPQTEAEVSASYEEVDADFIANVLEPSRAVATLLERVQLLGPELPSSAAVAMHEGAEAICGELTIYVMRIGPTGEGVGERWLEFAQRLGALSVLRATFFQEARAQIMTAPHPRK